MAGNSQRRGAMRKPGTKKGAVVGSGGQSRRAVKGRGPTPPAEARKGHPAARRRRPRRQSGTTSGGRAPGRARPGAGPSCRRRWSGETRWWRRCGPGCRRPRCTSRPGWPTTNGSPRPRRSGRAGHRVLEVSRPELDRMTGNAIHQGLALVVPPYQYAHPEDLLARAKDSGRAALIVAVDGVTDPRNLGRDRPVGGRVRRARRRGAGTAQRRHDGIGLAHVGRHRGPDPGGPLHQPGAHAEGLRGARA